ncbi:Meiosis-specific transcription factor NDT80 [Wickerhamomyces ciferrii]|uniref:Meiosis-specific transcription factor NDT80 n=1 Tax=Wickerhamomyces ciferrii (strain ATCC 14091 / BCRC 22168 / CBS 111 / JCM 3599 / NBRC 0793 / NRRL Y-1031 F-60-10) TaxID=1206466 RepID=K0K812_WICCF|nr:Meiosis-specific transcription factor NDT80 [Wickerhamomyces ciferrii]CCH40955.1 Meiosis-specific transcription factor NDT80 [Wickerhamomyces ciferrii]
MSDTPKTYSRRSSLLSTFLASSKKKLAPRSSLQFKIGPQFSTTLVNNDIINSKGETVRPIITPRIDRGFEMIDNEWVGYKRNYFTLVSAFCFKNTSFLKFVGDNYFTIDPETKQKVEIEYFALKLTSKCADDGSQVVLVQHTAKRDRGPQVEPPTHPAVPGDLPDHTTIREAANVRNTSKIAKLNRVFFFDRNDTNNGLINIRGLMDYPNDKIIKVARYERIQFSSSINYKKPSLNNKRFKLYVELVGHTSKGSFVPLAHTETPPLIVRGRSPSNYQGHESDNTPIDMSETIHSTPLESLDDYDTYQILKMATEDLQASPCIESRPKKKRGRKPKPKSEIQSVKKQKTHKSQKKNIVKKSSGHKAKTNSETNSTNFFSQHDDTPLSNFIDDSLLRPFSFETPDFNDVTKTPSPVLNMYHSKLNIQDENVDPYEFDDSAHLVDLFDTQMSYSGVERPHLTNITNSHSKEHQHSTNTMGNYDTELMQLKGHLKKEEPDDCFHGEFAKINPSEMLQVGDYEEGPSFIYS